MFAYLTRMSSCVLVFGLFALLFGCGGGQSNSGSQGNPNGSPQCSKAVGRSIEHRLSRITSLRCTWSSPTRALFDGRCLTVVRLLQNVSSKDTGKPLSANV